MNRGTIIVGFAAAGVIALGGGSASPAAPGAELLRSAWIAPELGSPERIEPNVQVDAQAAPVLATAAGVSAPAPATASPAESPAAKPAAGDGTSLRDRLAARSYKNDSGYGKPQTAATGTFGGKHTEAFANAVKEIDALARAKAANPSQAIGPYQGGDAALKNAAELPDKGYGYKYGQGARATNYGTDQMVFGLMEAFAVMADLYPDGTDALVGDIGKKEGGPLAPHVSHRTGRDVDLCLFGRTGDGKPVNRWISYDPQGNGEGGVHFDAARDWDYACALLESQRFEVVFILVHQPLKDLLLTYARGLRGKARSDGEAQHLDKLIKTADNLIRDGGSAHNNHYHLRIK